MALHAPPHHLPTLHIGPFSRRLLRDVAIALVLAIPIVLVIGTALAIRPALPQFIVTQAETQPLVDHRAGERASWLASQTSEGESILLYRAAERAQR